jgi:uncharacterized protein
VSDPRSPLRLNVGFIIHQQIGYSREFEFDLPRLRLGADLLLEYIKGVVRVSRTPQGLLIQAKLSAATPAECVRCLSDFPQLLESDFSELYAFNKRSITESGLILPEDGKIDLEPILREYLLLEIPISPLCRLDCKGLCIECGQNLNEGACTHGTAKIDPRLEVLKSLIKKE